MVLPRFSLQQQFGKYPLACIVDSSEILSDFTQQLRAAGWPRCCHIAPHPSDFGFPTGCLLHCSVLNLNTLRQVWDAQKELVLQLRLHELPPDYDTRLVLAIDCEITDFECYEMRELVRNCRNYHTMLLLRVPSCSSVPVAMLENTDLLTLTQPLAGMYTRFCQSEISFASFEQAIKDYIALVIQPRAVVRVQTYDRVATDKT